MISATVGWVVYEQTKDPAALAWMGLVQAIPLILFSLPAGQIADSLPRRRVMVTTQIIVTLSSTVMAYLAVIGALSPIAIYAVLLVNGIAGTFGRPARSSVLPSLVPEGDFQSAVTWNSTMFETLGVLSPWIAGMVLAYASAAAALVTAVVCMIGGIALTMMLPDYRIVGRREPVSFSQLMAGVRFVFRTRLMLAAMSLDLFAVLLGGATFLLPVFAERLGVGVVGYGWLRAAPPLGAIVTALIIAHRAPMQHAGRALLIAVAGFGVATIFFGLSTSFWISFGALVFCGVFDNISVVVRHTLVQTLTPDSMRGRVSAVNQVFIGSSNDLGGFESGITAKWFGPVASVVGGGIGTILVVLVVNVIFPQVRRLGSLRDLRPSDYENRK